MHEEARPSTSEVQNLSRVLTKCNSYKSKQCQGGLNRTTEADLPQISANANQTQLLLVGWARSSILQDSVKHAASKKKERNKKKAFSSIFTTDTRSWSIPD
jgi:hypothetical protein